MNCHTIGCRSGFLGKRAVAGLFFAALLAGAFAQTSFTPTAIAERGNALKHADSTSLGLFQAKRNAEAESALFATNRATPNTAKWHLECANALMRVAAATSAQGNAVLARELAVRALFFTAEAERAPANGAQGVTAAARELAGYIQENYIGDLPAAERSYESAVQGGTASEGAARGLARVRSAIANARPKQ